MRKTDNLLLWLTILLLYYGVFSLLHLNPFVQNNPVLILITIVVIMSTLRPLRRWVRVGIIRIFNPTYFEHNNRIKRLKRNLQITQPYNEIADQVLHELEEIFEARILALALKDNDDFAIINYRAPEPINLDNVTIDADSEMVAELQQKRRIVRVSRQSLSYNPTPQRQQDYRFKDYKLFNFAIPLKVNDTIIGAILTSNLQNDFIRDWQNGLLEDFAEYLGIVLRNSRLYNEVHWEALQKETLFEISKKITSTLDVREVLNLVIDSLNKVVNYSAAGIFLVKKGGHIVHEMIQRGYDEDKLSEVSLKVGHGIVGACIREKQPIIVGDVSDHDQYIEVRSTTKSEMCVPIYDNKHRHVVGAFNIESDELNAFSQNDLDRLTAFTSQVSIAIDNARLYKQVTESRRYERDIEVAREIQNAFLPKELPEHPAYDFAAICKPSQKVGGDFYDVHQFSQGKIGVAIGDVAGKGVPGAILMANLYAGYRSRVRSQDSIHLMVKRLNELLVESTNSEKYTTFFYAELETESGEVTYCNAGHNPPLIVHSDGSYEELTAGGPVVGALENSEYEEETVTMQPGDLLLLYTDGITESQNLQGEYYEVERLLDIVRRRNKNTSAEAIMDMINRDVYNFTNGDDLQDDVTVVTVLATQTD
ncbi:MAG: SpoIIE family protein phosphatase [Candidatus Marinimicrobia bacterium]|nr:SpoIIE family protein phosphatase [Candidatus Neomarinimicrobiota bacterium]MCF7828684.1 SpoIIE family protein phosphatase [Candidatus Neomarinimicrobiota bacterium]MCF7880425.1 SpoIIE family protein phosphatase [Candidatus Neomarinimicrobiota bacterium]